MHNEFYYKNVCCQQTICNKSHKYIHIIFVADLIGISKFKTFHFFRFIKCLEYAYSCILLEKIHIYYYHNEQNFK